MRIAILGGTFNPVHRGHLNIAEEVKSRFDYERIVFVPANIPAHKTMDMDVGPAHRLRMLQLAVAGYPGFNVDECELRRGGISYTIETVRELTRFYEVHGKPGLIIGDDLVEDFLTWKDVEMLVKMVDLIIAHRRSPSKVKIPFPCRYVDNSLFPVSSSGIRNSLRAGRRTGGGESFRDWLPAEVFEYIQRHDLYR